MTAWPRGATLLAGGVLVGSTLVACGTGSQVVVRPPTSTPIQTATPTPTPTAPVRIHPRISITPSQHLHDGQVVHVSARGFGPNQALVTIECVDLGTKTGQNTCNILGLAPIAVGASGTGSTNFTVRTGPFGSAHLSCTRRHPCIVSVSQATVSPTQNASARIGFD